jgi:uncharacterized membrane protein YhaH (DUF805 family)
MSFGDSVETCLRKYADFKGCASRAEFWWFVLFAFLAHVAAQIVGARFHLRRTAASESFSRFSSSSACAFLSLQRESAASTTLASPGRST